MSQARLNGLLVDDGGEACDCGFQYGETTAYGSTTPTDSKVTGETFDQLIVGLDPVKTYHFRSFATNSVGTSYGADLTFTTPVALPTNTTNPETNLGAVATLLNGTLDSDGGEACDCGFEYGKTVAYGSTTSTLSKITGQTFSIAVAALDPNTGYHFRSFARNSAGTSYGADRGFKTYPALSIGYALSRREL